MNKKGCFKLDVLGYIVVTIISLLISPFLKGLVNKFVEEDELEEKENKKVKVKFKPEFDWKIALVTILAETVLFGSFGISMSFFVYAFLIILLIVCMFADIKGCIIPNEINFLGFIVGIIFAYTRMCIDVKQGIDSLGGMLIGFLIFLAIAGLSMLVFKKEGMGGGDIKLMGVIGLYLGIFNNIQVFIFSFFIAAIISTILLVTKKKKGDDYIPFGPFIVLATYVTILFPASVTMPTLMSFIN